MISRKALHRKMYDIVQYQAMNKFQMDFVSIAAPLPRCRSIFIIEYGNVLADATCVYFFLLFAFLLLRTENACSTMLSAMFISQNRRQKNISLVFTHLNSNSVKGSFT